MQTKVHAQNHSIYSLPDHLLGQNLAISCILSRERCLLVLYAAPYQRLIARIANGTLRCGCYPYHAAFGYGENLPIDLHLSLTREEEIQLLVSAVSVQKTCLCTYGKTLKRELCTRSTSCSASEYLAGDLYLGTQLKYVLREFSHLAYRNAGIACTL